VKARRGSPRSTTTMDTEFALNLLVLAGLVPSEIEDRVRIGNMFGNLMLRIPHD